MCLRLSDPDHQAAAASLSETRSRSARVRAADGLPDAPVGDSRMMPQTASEAAARFFEQFIVLGLAGFPSVAA